MQDDRAIARDIASDVFTADLLEFQRLTEQFEAIRHWLLSEPPSLPFQSPQGQANQYFASGQA